MKKILLALLAMVICAASNAQVETLTGSGVESGTYGAPVLKTGLFNGKSCIMSGGRGALILNHKFAVGGGGYSMITDIESGLLSDNESPLYLNLSYGGFEMEYIHNSDRLVHWTIHTLMGSGSVELLEHKPDRTIDRDRVLVFEPAFNVDLNLCNWFRIGLGVSYRIFQGLEMDRISYKDINGLSGQIVFKFGSF